MVTENTATSITITWDSGNPDPVSYYVIEYKSKSQDGPYQIKEDITTTRYSIGGLSPNSEYEIWVSAVNSIGQGPPSESVVTRTGEQAPASAPRNVQARMLSASTMIIQWEEPVEPNGLIRGYRVYYTMEPEHPVGNWQKHNVDDSLLTTVGSLLEDETYTVRVLAFTSVGDGPLSDPIQVKTQQGGELPGAEWLPGRERWEDRRVPPPGVQWPIKPQRGLFFPHGALKCFHASVSEQEVVSENPHFWLRLENPIWQAHGATIGHAGRSPQLRLRKGVPFCSSPSSPRTDWPPSASEFENPWPLPSLERCMLPVVE